MEKKNGIITTEIYKRIKNNDNIYNLTITEYLTLGDISPNESYNINKAIEEGIVNKDTLYKEYFAKTCGFKNKRELLKYTKRIIELSSKEILSNKFCGKKRKYFYFIKIKKE